MFSENLLAIEMNKARVEMNKPIYLDMSILEISKIEMYKFWYDYIKLKYGSKVNLCYMVDADRHMLAGKGFIWDNDWATSPKGQGTIRAG